MRLSIVYGLILQLFVVASNAQDDMTPEELESWFNSDEITPVTPTSEGELKFLTEALRKQPTHSYNKITITQQSISDGWVDLYQCYSQLDPVSETVIAYRYKKIRNLAIQLKNNIGNTSIKGQSVELMDVQKGAKLCISAQVRIFYQNKDGSYRLVNGPFHRKFLDGYFPFKVTLDIDYPSKMIKLVKSVPEVQAGYQIVKKQNNLYIQSIFVGKLDTELVFKLVK